VTLVVDASIAVKWLVDEPDHIAARNLLDRDEELQAPDFVLIEAGNVLWKKVLRCEITPQHASEGMDSLPRLFETMLPSSLLVARALRIAACAERSNADLVTADKQFVAKARAGAAEARIYELSEVGNVLR